MVSPTVEWFRNRCQLLRGRSQTFSTFLTEDIESFISEFDAVVADNAELIAQIDELEAVKA